MYTMNMSFTNCENMTTYATNEYALNTSVSKFQKVNYTFVVLNSWILYLLNTTRLQRYILLYIESVFQKQCCCLLP